MLLLFLGVASPAKGYGQESALWTVHIGSYRSASNVTSMADRVKEANVTGFTQPVKAASGQRLTRLLVGPFRQKETARTAQGQLKQNGMEGRLLQLSLNEAPLRPRESEPPIVSNQRSKVVPGVSGPAPELSVLECLHRSREALGSGKPEEALEPLLKKDPSNPEALILKLASLILSGNESQARSLERQLQRRARGDRLAASGPPTAPPGMPWSPCKNGWPWSPNNPGPGATWAGACWPTIDCPRPSRPGIGPFATRPPIRGG